MVLKGKVRVRVRSIGTALSRPSEDLWGNVPVKIVVKDVLKKLYEVRNCLVHGRKIPDHFFNVTVRSIAACI